MTEAEEKGMVLEVADWLWGTVQGSFNQQQTTSQIIVDAVIGMVPLVGDVTAVRDLLAVVLRLARDPEKRNDKTEWMLLVVLLFALIPVVGGMVKGFGRLLLRAGAKTSITDVIKILNRIGTGNAVEWLKKLDLEDYLEQPSSGLEQTE
jgi:hypothetical protein